MKNKTQSKRYAISYPYLSSPSIFVNQFARVVLGITGKTGIRILLGSGHFSANQKVCGVYGILVFFSALSPGSLRIRVVALFFSALRYLLIILGLILLVAFSNASFLFKTRPFRYVQSTAPTAILIVIFFWMACHIVSHGLWFFFHCMG